MPIFVFDAYGTLLDVHAAVARHRAAAGPDAERLSEIWRIKQLEYSWLKSRGSPTAILSNGTPAMLSSAIAAAKLESVLDAVLSVDGLRIYKPRPEVYQLACDLFQVTPPEIIFISANRWDVMGAQAFGFRTCWVNRMGAPDEYGESSQTIASLAELATIDGSS